MFRQKHQMGEYPELRVLIMALTHVLSQEEQGDLCFRLRNISGYGQPGTLWNQIRQEALDVVSGFFKLRYPEQQIRNLVYTSMRQTLPTGLLWEMDRRMIDGWERRDFKKSRPNPEITEIVTRHVMQMAESWSGDLAQIDDPKCRCEIHTRLNHQIGQPLRDLIDHGYQPDEVAAAATVVVSKVFPFLTRMIGEQIKSILNGKNDSVNGTVLSHDIYSLAH